MPNEGRESLTLQGWLMRGAIREDDNQREPSAAEAPDTEGKQRVFHHFYDPVHDRGLQGKDVITMGRKAPDWAIGTGDVFTRPNTPDFSGENNFSWFEAREALYRALTGRGGDGNPKAVARADRDRYWATVFRSLGDVVHLVQDMAQPQHTRNDPPTRIASSRSYA